MVVLGGRIGWAVFFFAIPLVYLRDRNAVNPPSFYEFT
jgi:hypothetical protein